MSDVLRSQARAYAPRVDFGYSSGPAQASTTASQLILSWIGTLPLDQRREILMNARTLPRVDAIIPNIAKLIPGSATLEQQAATLGGHLLRSIAIGLANDDSTKVDILNLAKTLATRTPIQGDPGGTTSLTTAAGLAMATDPAAAAEFMLSSLPPSAVAQAMIELTGDTKELPLHGGLWSTIKRIGKYISGAVSDKVQDDPSAPEPVKAAAALILPSATLPGSTSTLPVSIPSEVPSDKVRVTLESDLSALRDSLSALEADLQAKNATMEEQKLNMARISWALACLNTDDEMASVLTNVKPDLTTVTPAVQSVFGLVESLRQNTSLTKFGTIARALSAMFGKNPAASAWLTGDPSAADFAARIAASSIADMTDADDFADGYSQEGGEL